MSIDFGTGYIDPSSEPTVANSRISIAEAKEDIESAIAKKGYTFDANANNVFKIAYSSTCILVNGNQGMLGLSYLVGSISSDGLDINADAAGSVLKPAVADRQALRKVIRKLVGQLEYCQNNKCLTGIAQNSHLTIENFLRAYTNSVAALNLKLRQHKYPIDIE